MTPWALVDELHIKKEQFKVKRPQQLCAFKLSTEFYYVQELTYHNDLTLSNYGWHHVIVIGIIYI